MRPERTADRGTVGVEYSDPYGLLPRPQISMLAASAGQSTKKVSGAVWWSTLKFGGRGKSPCGSEYSTPTVGRCVFLRNRCPCIYMAPGFSSLKLQSEVLPSTLLARLHARTHARAQPPSVPIEEAPQQTSLLEGLKSYRFFRLKRPGGADGPRTPLVKS